MKTTRFSMVLEGEFVHAPGTDYTDEHVRAVLWSELQRLNREEEPVEVRGISGDVVYGDMRVEPPTGE